MAALSNKCVYLAEQAAAYLQSSEAYVLEEHYEGAEQHSCDVSICQSGHSLHCGNCAVLALPCQSMSGPGSLQTGKGACY